MAYWPHMMTQIWVNTVSGYGLLPDRTRRNLNQCTLITCILAFVWKEFHKMFEDNTLKITSQKCLKTTPWKLLQHLSGANYLNHMHWLIQFGFIVTLDNGIQGTNITITLMHLTYTCSTIIYFSMYSQLGSTLDHSWHFIGKPIW